MVLMDRAHRYEASSPLRRKNKISKYHTLMENWQCGENISALGSS